MRSAALSLPLFAAITDKVQTIMDVILHIGAQRTATTTFHAYMRGNSAALSAQGIGYWGPHRTRKRGVLSGLVPVRGSHAPSTAVDEAVARAHGEITADVNRLKRRRKSHLIVSDENMLGTARGNVRARSLYPGAAQRLDRVARGFDGIVTRVVISIRSFETYWPSALAFSLGRGGRLSRPEELDQMVEQTRSWRDVITDTACAFPGVEIVVDDHETYAGRPERRLAHMVDGAIDVPMEHARLWLHRSPDLAQLRAAFSKRGGNPAKLPSGEGRWYPFDALQNAKLRETYADDMFWLHAGADGLATLITEDQPDQAGENLPGGATTRGQTHDRKNGGLARTG